MSFELVGGVLLRLLFVVYAVQFASTVTQIVRHIGPHGVEPAESLFAVVKQDLGLLRGLVRFPSIFWLSSSELMLKTTCLLGVGLALLGASGYAQDWTPLILGLCWLGWLSVQVSASTCFSLPWDNLLTEAGFLALFLPGLLPLPTLELTEAADPAVELALRWLVLRVMFGMGLAKFRQIDKETKSGAFLQRYYDHQPIPNRLAYRMSRLPLAFHQACTVGFFVVEIVIPWLMFMPQPLPSFVAVCFIGLQIVIFVFGSFGVFNVLMATLAISLFADQSVVALLGSVELSFAAVILFAHALLSVPLLLFLDSWTNAGWMYSRRHIQDHRFFSRIAGLIPIYRLFAPFHILNAYGIFVPGVFRRPRTTLIIQGTIDGHTWEDYVPNFLPVDPAQAPLQAAPHHPRLDHYLFYERNQPFYRTFAWLFPTNPYYLSSWSFKDKLAQKLLRGNPVVMGLWGRVPFAGSPPQSLRYSMWKYRFTSPQQRRTTGCWWSREFVGASRPFSIDPEFGPLTGIRRKYDPFMADRVQYAENGAVGYVDRASEEWIEIQQHPISPDEPRSSMLVKPIVGH